MTQFYCTCDAQSGWAHIGDQWWVHPSCGKPSRMFWEMRMGFDDRTVWATPPRGITKSTVRIGPDIRHHYTYFCEADDECFAVAYAMTEDGARRQLDGHICPAPVRRDLMPCGKTAVQKMWDELDWFVDKIKENECAPEDMIRYKAMSQATAMCLAFVAIPYFRSRDDILRQANRRWRMRTGEIPWEATPGYNYTPAAPLAYAKPEPEPVKTRAPLKATKKAAAPAKPAVRDFTVAERTMIQDGIHKNGMKAEDLANMFGVSRERIMTIAGPTPSEGDDNPLFPVMF